MVKRPPVNWNWLGVRSTATEWTAVALLGQECSSKIAPAGGKFQASACRHQKFELKKNQNESIMRLYNDVIMIEPIHDEKLHSRSGTFFWRKLFVQLYDLSHHMEKVSF